MKERLKKIPKKYIYIGLTLMIIPIVIIMILLLKDDNHIMVTGRDSDKFRKEYEALNGENSSDAQKYPEVNISSNNMKYISIDETLAILEDGTAAIYIGYAKCLYCRSAVEVLVNTANKSNLDNVYYLDISKVWDERELNNENKIVVTKEAHEKYNSLLKELGDEYIENYILTTKDGKKIDTKQKRVSVPLVIFVVNGDIVSSNIGTLFSQEDPYTPLNKDQITGLSEIYSYGIKDVIEGSKNK